MFVAMSDIKISERLRLSTQPVAWEKAVKSVIAVLVLFGVIEWTEDQIVGVLVAFEAVVGIMVWSSVTPNRHVEGKVNDAVVQKEAEINTYLAVEAKRQEDDFFAEVAPLIANATDAIEESRRSRNQPPEEG